MTDADGRPLAQVPDDERLLIALDVDGTLIFPDETIGDAVLGEVRRVDALGHEVMLATGRSWVKISGAYHISPDELGNPDVTALARALVVANPDRVVWGSDWPHLGKHEPLPDGSPPKAIYRPIDYGALVSVLAEWVPDTAIRARVMAANARRLYGFD